MVGSIIAVRINGHTIPWALTVRKDGGGQWYRDPITGSLISLDQAFKLYAETQVKVVQNLSGTNDVKSLTKHQRVVAAASSVAQRWLRRGRSETCVVVATNKDTTLETDASTVYVPLQTFSSTGSSPNLTSNCVSDEENPLCGELLVASMESKEGADPYDDCELYSSSSLSEGEQEQAPDLTLDPSLLPLAPDPSVVPPTRNGPILTSTELNPLSLVYGKNTIEYLLVAFDSAKSPPLSPELPCAALEPNILILASHEARVFLWSSVTKLVISDVDGTITRSDGLGLVLPTLGIQYAHQGIAQLYSAIEKQGYAFLYVTSRGISQAKATRSYLQQVRQATLLEGAESKSNPTSLGFEVGLPEGPVLTSPDSVFTALKREVVLRTPHEFKITTLSEISRLFTTSTASNTVLEAPFSAAFGNRPSDMLAYAAVGVPKAQTYMVNPAGELVSMGKQPDKSLAMIDSSVSTKKKTKALFLEMGTIASRAWSAPVSPVSDPSATVPNLMDKSLETKFESPIGISATELIFSYASLLEHVPIVFPRV
jgi:hypothetical protein